MVREQRQGEREGEGEGRKMGRGESEQRGQRNGREWVEGIEERKRGDEGERPETMCEHEEKGRKRRDEEKDQRLCASMRKRGEREKRMTVRVRVE